MGRLTRLVSRNRFVVDEDRIILIDGGYSGEAVDKLAKFEDFYEELLSSQKLISEEMEKLRKENKMKSAKFKELMTRKLINVNLISLFEKHGF